MAGWASSRSIIHSEPERGSVTRRCFCLGGGSGRAGGSGRLSCRMTSWKGAASSGSTSIFGCITSSPGRSWA
eukprot:scaffold8708_cov54-Phaeocystis_antarctica.AAC.3